MPRLPRGWTGEGIIVRAASQALASHTRAANTPAVVNISAIDLLGVDFPRVTSDVECLMQLAVQHFLDRGFLRFAYCGSLYPTYVMERHYRLFERIVAAAGCECDCYKPHCHTTQAANWPAQQKDLMRWLTRLPTPVAVLTWATERGRDVIEACRELGLLVPEQIAVLASDDDDVLNDVCNPPLSGIELGARRIGHEAASLLDRLMHGDPPPRKPILLPPVGVRTRQSTDTLAIEDHDVAQAVEFIRNHAAEPIQVSDVLRVVPVSRSRLERQFIKVLGRTPAAEIRRVHLERAKQLLATTDMPIPKIAYAAGFSSAEYMSCAFKSETGLAPHRYRGNLGNR